MTYKRLALIALITISAATATDNANAQIFRRACANGSCYRTTTSYTAPRVEYTPRPCESVATVEPCAPIATTPEPVEPCAPVEVVEPCAPVADCAECEGVVRYSRTTEVGECVNGTCPIRRVVKGTAQTAVDAVATVASTARFLVAVNAVRARYGLRPLQGDAYLDKGCATQAGVCAARSTLIHAPGCYEILAQNTSGFDAALNQWVASQGHAALLLNPSFRYVGVAVKRDASGRYWCAMRFR